MSLNKKELIYKLANKYDLPIKVVEAAVTYQFKYTANIISSGTFDSVRLPYFGKWWVKQGRVDHINRLKAKKNKKLDK